MRERRLAASQPRGWTARERPPLTGMGLATALMATSRQSDWIDLPRLHQQTPATSGPKWPSSGGLAVGSGSGSELGSNPDRYPYPDNRQRYNDHQHINRQPSGYAGHSVCPPQPRYVPEERKWL